VIAVEAVAHPEPLPHPEAVPRYEYRVRGALMAALVVPAGVCAWLLLYSAGILTSIISAGIAIGAAYLYRSGANTISRRSIAPIVAVVVLALALCFVSVLVFDQLRAFAEGWGIGWWSALVSSEFGYFIVHHVLFTAEGWVHYLPAIGISTVLAAVACTATISSLLRKEQLRAAEPAALPASPILPGMPDVPTLPGMPTLPDVPTLPG
jgi:hypothetical protein